MNRRKFFLTRLAILALVLVIGLGGVSINFSAGAFARALLEATVTSSVPNYVNFQGVVRDADGKRLTGSYTMLFAIYDQPIAGTKLWEETQPNITARDGTFSVLLGTITPFPSNLFTVSPDRYVGVIVNGVEMQPRQRFASVPYTFHAVQADNALHAVQADNGVPVGTVIDWWRPDTNLSLPGGYLPCDGRTVNDAQSPLNGKALPNLLNKFVRGVTNPNQIGLSGGNENYSIPFTFDLPAVTSETTQSGEGATDVRDGSGVKVIPITSNHTHRVTIDPASYQGTTNQTTILPPYIGLLKLCRIK